MIGSYPRCLIKKFIRKEPLSFFTDYTIKTFEMSVSLEQDDQVIRLMEFAGFTRP